MDWRSDDVRWGPEAAAEAEGPEENISCSLFSYYTVRGRAAFFAANRPTDGCRRSWHFAPIAASALCERPLPSSAFLARPKGALILVADRPPFLLKSTALPSLPASTNRIRKEVEKKRVRGRNGISSLERQSKWRLPARVPPAFTHSSVLDPFCFGIWWR